MKKRFTILFGAFCALMILISMPGKAVGQTTTINFETNAIPDGWTNTNQMAVVANPISNTSTTNGSYCLSTNGKGNCSLTSGLFENVTSISVDATRTSSNTTNEVYIDFCPNTSFGNSDTQTQAVTVNRNSWATSTLTLSSTANGYVRIRRSGGNSTATKFIDNIVITCSSGGGQQTVATPTFNVASGTYFENQTVTISCATDGATIYYTTDGTTPSNTNGTQGTSVTISAEGSTILKAIAYVGEDASSVASVTYTIHHPLTTMDAIFAQATSLGTSGGTAYITFNNWVVSGVNGNTAYVTDGTKGFIIYKSSHGLTVGKILNGSNVQCTLKLYNGAAEITNWDSNFSSTTGGTITPEAASINDFSGVNTGAVFSLTRLTYDGTDKVLSDGTYTIKPYNQLYSSMSFTDGKMYNVTGVYLQFNITKEILPRGSSDIVEVNDPSISAAASLTVPSYVQGTPVANITAGSLSVSGSNLTADITCTLDNDSKFELYNGSQWTNTTTISQTNGSASGTLQIRLKSGQEYNASAYTGSVTLSSAGATPVVVSLSGSVTYAVLTYYGNADDVSNVPAAVNCTYEESVEVAGVGSMTRTGYTFAKWNTDQAGHGTDYGPSTSNTSITITQNITLYAQWTGIPSDINISDMTGGSVIAKVGDAGVEEAPTGETVTLEVSPEPNHVLNTLTVTKGNPSVIVELTQTSANTYTFTMPAVAVTVTATFSEADIYALYSGDITEGDYVIYYSGKALKNSVTSNRLDYSEVTPVSDQIVDPDADIVWHISKSGDYWKIYNAADDSYAASNGTDKQAALDDGSDTKSSWIVTGTSTYDFENVYKTNNYKYLRNNTTYGFACYQSGTGGALTLYKKVVYSTLAVANVANGTITATPAESSAIAEGSSNTVSSGTTITLSATGEGTYVLDYWDVYKTEDASTQVTVTNNQFTMPDYGVTVSASFRQPTTFTVSYSVNGEIVSTQSNIAEGSPVTLPTDISAPIGFTKVGWTENEVSAELISTATYTPTDNTILYLVFVKSGQTAGYNKVTSLNNITPGTYIIVNDNHCLPNVSTGSNGKPAKTDDYIVTNASSTSNYTTVPANTEWFFTGTKTAMTIKNASDDYLYAINDNAGLRVHTTSDTWAFETNSTGFAMKEATNNKYCATYTNDWRSYGTKDHSNYSDGGILYIYKKTPVYTRVYNTTTTTMANIPATSIVTVPNGVTLTLTGTNQGDETNLIIEDGGQLICSNSVKATFNKNITAASTTVVSDENWYLISSPVGTVNTSDVTNLLGSGNHKYNLYKFNETSAAWNGNGGENHFETLAKGMGYLYRNNDGADLSFTGTTVTGDYEYDVELTRHATALPGFNLLGNPYSHNITSKYITLSDDAEFNGCYVLETDGTWTSNLDNVIKPGEGFFVQVSKDATATFHETAQRTGKYNEEYIQFMVSNNDYKDVTFALFDKGIGLKKIDHRNSDVQMVYIKQNNEDYAIATMSDDTKSFDLCFKSKTIGQYTLKYKTHGEFNYIHVIDRMTGEDIDMLVEREYKFISAPKDSENRFIVKLGYLPDYSDVENDIFAFQNGSEILVSGEGELQIFDVTGRNVMTTTINGAESINIPTQCVYIFRLIGTEVKTQKIVVR